MKKITFIIAISGLLLFAACKPESLKDYQTFSSASITSLKGVWKLSKVTQTDEDSRRKLFPYKTLDLTSSLKLTDVVLTLNGDATAPTNFTINYGAAPQVFKISTGTWKLDDNNKPGKLWIINGVDTTKFTLGAYSQLANNKMSLKQFKSLGATQMITYEYEFSKN
jgi:Domain of unknown function (DUF5004)